MFSVVWLAYGQNAFFTASRKERDIRRTLLPSPLHRPHSLKSRYHIEPLVRTTVSSVCPSVRLSVRLSVRPSVRPSVRLSVGRSGRLCVHTYMRVFSTKVLLAVQNEIRGKQQPTISWFFIPKCSKDSVGGGCECV